MQPPARRLTLLIGAACVLGACGLQGERGVAGLTGAPTNAVQRPERAETAAAMLAGAEELRASGKPVQALARLAEARRRYPQDAAVASAYGRVALLLGHDALAAPLLAEAMAADPRDWRALSAQGVLESRSGRLPEGRRALAKANTISSSEAAILNNLAVNNLLGGNPAAAISLLRQGLAAPALKPEHQRRLKRNLALALATQGQFEEADYLAGEAMPRDLAGADARRMQRILGVSAAPLAAEAGWKAQLATSATPQKPALQ
jgi:Flp pilus assembly protein TadD